MKLLFPQHSPQSSWIRMMVCPRLAPLLGCILFLTVVWYHTHVRTTTNPSTWFLPCFPRRNLFDPSFLSSCVSASCWALAQGTCFLILKAAAEMPDSHSYCLLLSSLSLLTFYLPCFGNPITCPFSIFCEFDFFLPEFPIPSFISLLWEIRLQFSCWQSACL